MEPIKRIDALLSMLRSEPKDIFLNYSLGIEYFSAGNLSLAEEQFMRTISFQPDYVPAFYQLGKLYEQKQQNQKALDYYNKGLDFARVQNNNKAVNEFGEAIFMLED